MTEQNNQNEPPESLASRIVRVILIVIGVGAVIVVVKHFKEK